MSEPTSTTAQKTVPAPPPVRRGPRLVGNPLAGLPKEVADRMLAEAGIDSKRLGEPAGKPSIPTGAAWGTNGAEVDAAYGTILDARIKRASEKEKYPDNSGETKAYLYYDFRNEGSFTCLIAGSLEPGDEIAIGGETLYVNDAEKQWEHKGWSKYSVTAEAHDSLGT